MPHSYRFKQNNNINTQSSGTFIDAYNTVKQLTPSVQNYYYYYIHLTAVFQDNLGKPAP